MNTEANTKKILVADDEPDIRETLASVLRDEGFTVLEAEHGKQALEIALNERPDLILLDLMMPVMGGLEALEALRKDVWGRQARVILLTARDDVESVTNAMEAGGNDYLMKPNWKIENIVAKVRQNLTDYSV